MCGDLSKMYGKELGIKCQKSNRQKYTKSEFISLIQNFQFDF